MSDTDEVTRLTTAHLPQDWTELDKRAVDTIRVLAADAVQKAGNGHPGTAMSLAPTAYTLFQRVMRHDPTDPHWLGRDRFVLSAGHSSLTLYLQLFLAGYGLELDDIKALRTWGSKTPGHPEVHHTAGVEITTGPLGRVWPPRSAWPWPPAASVGCSTPTPPPGQSPFDHHIYVIASDGDIEEGVTSEASSIAGTQQLGNLMVIYDDNQISIEDDTTIALSEDTGKRYEAYGWHVQHVEGGENVTGILEAIENGEGGDRPAVDHRAAHDHRLPGADQDEHRQGARRRAGRRRGRRDQEGSSASTPRRSFEVADEVLAHARKAVERGKARARGRGRSSFDMWAADNAGPQGAVRPADRAASCRTAGPTSCRRWDVDPKGVATRKASSAVLDALADVLPELWGGSADLAESNNTTMEGADSFGPASIATKEWNAHPYGRTLHFGIREHAMGAILSGIALHGPTRPYGGTFLTFSDYMRGAVRLASLMNIPVTYVWTHDSIGLGEDGPTHQPIEHVAALRAIPNLCVVRPGDANETAYAWKALLEQRRPTGIALTRQNLPVLEGTERRGRRQGRLCIGRRGIGYAATWC